MRTWNDYKEEIKKADSEIARGIEGIESVSAIVSAMVEQRTVMALSQRDLAAMCRIPQSSPANFKHKKSRGE